MGKYASPLLVLLGLVVACGSSTPTSGSTGTTSSGAGGSSSTTTGFVTASGTGGTTTQASSTSASTSTSTTSSGGGANYSCTVTSTLLHECTLYLDPTSTDLATYMGDCAALDGTNGTTCSQAGALGTCSTDYGNETWYSDGGTTAAEAETSCQDSNGTWTPG